MKYSPNIPQHYTTQRLELSLKLEQNHCGLSDKINRLSRQNPSDSNTPIWLASSSTLLIALHMVKDKYGG